MKPLRIINAGLVAALLGVVVVTYNLKHNAEVAEDNINQIQANIAVEKDKIRTLDAEWAALNQPSRLEAVVNEHSDYFQLQSFLPDQIATITEIPLRGATPAPSTGSATAPTANNDAAVKATLARIAAGGALRPR